MIRRFAIPSLLVLALATSCANLSAAAATVNGQRITEAQVESELDVLRGDPVFGDALQRDPDTRGQRRRQILTQLIYQMVAEQEARQRDIVPTQAQIDRLIEQAAASRGMSAEELLEAENLTRDDANRLAERDVRRFALIEAVTGEVAVDEERVRQIYEGQQERFVDVHLERITVPDEQAAQEVLEAHNRGSGFGELARAHSTDELAEESGDMGFVPITALGFEVQDAVTRVVEGGVTEPIPSGGSLEVYRLVERRTKPFEEVAPEIRAALSQDQRDQEYARWLADRVRAADIVVNPKYGTFDRDQPEPQVVGPDDLDP